MLDLSNSLLVPYVNLLNIPYSYEPYHVILGYVDRNSDIKEFEVAAELQREEKKT